MREHGRDDLPIIAVLDISQVHGHVLVILLKVVHITLASLGFGVYAVSENSNVDADKAFHDESVGCRPALMTESARVGANIAYTRDQIWRLLFEEFGREGSLWRCCTEGVDGYWPPEQ